LGFSKNEFPLSMYFSEGGYHRKNQRGEHQNENNKAKEIDNVANSRGDDRKDVAEKIQGHSEKMIRLEASGNSSC